MKNIFNYKVAMKRLRGKVSFNYDLRKSLSAGQKSAIKKAHNLATEYGIAKTTSKATFLKIPRKRGETKKKYSKRVKTIKKNMGQSDTQFTGVFTDSPVHLKDVHFSFKGNKLTITRPKFGYVEAWEDIDTDELAMKGYWAIRGIVEEYRELGFQRFQFVSNGAYRSGESILLSASDDFISRIVEARLNAYSDFESWLTGMIFTKNAN